MSIGRKLCLALAGGLLLSGAALSAQTPTGTVTGRVVDGATQEPLSGAIVTVGERRTVTGAEGRYSIVVPAGSQTVRATRLGYGEGVRAVTVTAGQTVTADFTLTPAALALEGLVAIGYGEVRERDRTGAVTQVTTEEFNPGRVVSAEQLIQSKVAGVQVVDSGEPGAGINIRIRGATSVNASSEPLFVIDGVPLAVGGGISAGRNPLNFLNPSDIESVTVLKDASATAIYGSRGANGVVLITTKSGRSGPQFTYTSTVSRSVVTGNVDLLDAGQFRAAVQQYAPENVARLGSASTDWREAVQRDATGQEHTLAIAGASDQMNYRLSLGYLDQDGVVRGTTTERISAALTYNHTLFDDRLNLSANLRGARTDDRFTPGGVLGAASAMAPTQPITGNFFGYFEWDDALGANNPIAELDLVQDEGRTYRSVGNIEAAYRLPWIEGVRTTLRLGYDVIEAERESFFPSILRAQRENSLGGTINRQNPSQTNTLLDLFATYERGFDRYDADFDFTAGYSHEDSRRTFPSFFAQGLSSDLLGPDGIPSAEEQRNFLDIQEAKLISGFARTNLTLRDRYILTLSVRRDGSSRFGPGNQWGTFPSAALAWRASEESFLQDVGWLSDLKVRASYGVNGNQEFGNYLWIPTYLSGSDEVQAQFGNEFVSTLRPSAVDPNIKWEETTSYNLGLDYGLFDGRVSGSIEYYFKDTKDLIFSVPVAAGTNLSNFVTTNIGSVENRGLELSLNALVLDGGSRGLSWDASFNAATNRNRLTQINSVGGGAEQIPVGGIAGGVGSTIQVLQPGQPLNAFFVYEHRRDDNGRPVYADVNGDGSITDVDLYVDQNNDNVINQQDRRAFHSPQPVWTLGHTSQFGYRDVDLSFTLRAYLGNYVYNNVASNQGNYAAVRGGAPTNLHASVLETGFVNPQYFSDVYVEDASFLRMDNLTLGYTFNRFRGVEQLRVFGTVQNVFTLTGYDGLDPTAGLNGIDNNIYPRSRTFSLGVNVGF